MRTGPLYSGTMTPDELHALIRASDNPIHQAGYIANSQASHEDVEWVLEHFGYHHLVWLGLLIRSDITQEWIALASQIPHASVLGSLISHRFTTVATLEWIRDYSTELASAEGDEKTRAGFEHVAEYASRALEQRKTKGATNT